MTKKRMTHKQKVRLARRLMQQWEVRTKVPIFSSEAWSERNWQKHRKQHNQGIKK